MLKWIRTSRLPINLSWQAEEFKAAAALQDPHEEDGEEARMKQLYNAATAYSQVPLPSAWFRAKA